jgi:hypothetical protein
MCLSLEEADPNRGGSYREAWADELAYECGRPAVGARVYPDCEGFHVVEEPSIDGRRTLYYDVGTGRLAAIVEDGRSGTRCFGGFVTLSTNRCVRRDDCGNAGGL